MPEFFLQWAVPLVVGGLLTLYFLGLLRRQVAQFRLRRPLLEVTVVSRSAVASVLGWLTLLLLNRFLGKQAETQELSLLAIQVSCGLNLLITSLLPILLTDGGRRSLESAGLSTADSGRQLLLGIAGYLAAIWPTGVLLIVSQFWRNMQTEHVFLNALRNTERGEIITWIALSAVLAAPLAEELLFRVTLQGWLSERMADPAAIGATALLFALIHGWRDALPLIPLALILGFIYQKTRSYWACVVTHGLFNATNLLLAILSG